jgi:uncharacterized protein YbbK (DUF523 family)
MKLHCSITLATIALALFLTTGAGAVAQDVGSDAGKSAKSRCYATVKMARKTATGTTTGGKSPSAGEHDVKKTGHRR